MEKRDTPDRRKKPTPILSRYTVFGRRGAFRRRQDREKGGYVDRYGHALFIWALLLIVLNIIDAAFTRIIIDHGGYEVNPIMNWFIENFGDHFVLWKLAIISGSVIIICLHSKFLIVKPVFYFSILIYTIVIIHQMLLIYSL
jgi:hypothetical protein